MPIVLSAFGTTVASARRVYADFEAMVRTRFDGHPIHWMFTSSIVRRRLLEDQGIAVPAPAELLETLAREGHPRVVVQSLHVTPGQEYQRLTTLAAEGMSVSFGQPLLADSSDDDRVLDVLARELRADRPNIIVGHGNDRHPEYNETNIRLARRIRERFEGAVLASLEGVPGAAPLEEVRPFAIKAGAAHFLPILFVAGDHVQNDLMGDEPESWRNRLGVERVTCSPPLGEYPAIREIYLDHLEEAVRGP